MRERARGLGAVVAIDRSSIPDESCSMRCVIGQYWLTYAPALRGKGHTTSADMISPVICLLLGADWVTIATGTEYGGDKNVRCWELCYGEGVTTSELGPRNFPIAAGSDACPSPPVLTESRLRELELG